MLNYRNNRILNKKTVGKIFAILSACYLTVLVPKISFAEPNEYNIYFKNGKVLKGYQLYKSKENEEILVAKKGNEKTTIKKTYIEKYVKTDQDGIHFGGTSSHSTSSWCSKKQIQQYRKDIDKTNKTLQRCYQEYDRYKAEYGNIPTGVQNCIRTGEDLQKFNLSLLSKCKQWITNPLPKKRMTIILFYNNYISNTNNGYH